MPTEKKANINVEEYRDKVLGCWTGKNIGGTLGAPFEGARNMQNVSFYTQELNGMPVPNDDLDLQLIWLFAAEQHGIYNINERLLAEYWMGAIIGPWNEYAVCQANIRNGLYPPLSGSCNNDRWKNSNGAWIRSEIWACLFPGLPDQAAEFAYIDACVDHCGDGIYAEIFTASLESAAFVVNDIRMLINIGLSKIPSDSRVARSVNLACEHYDKKSDFASARNAIVKDSEDLGWFQAPANIGFLVLGLLYGEGDFGKSICYAVNCGDDTDCTAATAGAILGIMNGRKAIPEKWVDPIGETIQTVAINTIGFLIPKTLTELAERVMHLASAAQYECPNGPLISSAPTNISEEYLIELSKTDSIDEYRGYAYPGKKISSRSPFELTYDLPFGTIKVDYENGPEVIPGEAKNLRLSFSTTIGSGQGVILKWQLPEDWNVSPSREINMNSLRYLESAVTQTIQPRYFEGAYFYMRLEIRLSGRNTSAIIDVPLQKKGAVDFSHRTLSTVHFILERHLDRLKSIGYEKN